MRLPISNAPCRAPIGIRGPYPEPRRPTALPLQALHIILTIPIIPAEVTDSQIKHNLQHHILARNSKTRGYLHGIPAPPAPTASPGPAARPTGYAATATRTPVALIISSLISSLTFTMDLVYCQTILMFGCVLLKGGAMRKILLMLLVFVFVVSISLAYRSLIFREVMRN